MKVIAYKNLCKKKRKHVHLISCSRPIFKPLVFSIGIAVVMLIFNLFIFNFFANINASIQNFVQSFVKYLLGIC